MKIAFVQDWLTGFAGGEQVLLALHEMYPDAPIYTSLYNPEKVPQFAKAKVIPSYLQGLPGLVNHHQIAIPLMPAAFESFNLKDYDVVVSVGGGLSKGVITYPGQRHISYCHTPIRYIWRFGGDVRAGGSWLREKVSHSLRIWDVASAERVDQFIGNSHTIADRIAKIYRMPSKVVYPPIHTENYSVSADKPGNYFVTVSRIISYKRLDIIVKACIQTKQPLKIVGTGPDAPALQKMAAGAPWIEFVGRVSDAELQKLYKHARAFIFAAEEDFGIVPVEAMACGRPVIAYGKGGVTETVEEGRTGVFFNEQTTESLVKVLEHFDETTYNSTYIRKQAERFSVERFKDEMRKIIEFRS